MSEEDDLLAAELAFGLIADDERRAAEARAAGDPAFAAAVDRWRAHAAALATGPGEVPRPSLWAAIAARLPANEDTTVETAHTSRWRIVAIAASLLAAMMTVVAIERRPATPPPAAPAPSQAPLVALLRGKAGDGVVAVSFDPGQRRLTLAAAAFDPGAHSPELWLIPVGGKPVSLGVLDPAVPRTRTLTGIDIAPGATMAVSIEPIGGSPTGQPTGAVVLSGIVGKS